MFVLLPVSIAALLPAAVSSGLCSALAAQPSALLQDIRIRRDKPLSVTVNNARLFLTKSGTFSTDPAQARRASSADMAHVIGSATAGSLYAVEEDMRRGFLPLVGGHRLGLTGEAALHNGGVQAWRHISSLYIRVAHQRLGCASGLMSALSDDAAGLQSTLLVGPPGAGKTTMLRDLTRLLSRRYQVAVADERWEISGSYHGAPQLDIGEQTDVMAGVPKAVAMPMLVRSFSPDIIITDELGDPADVAAVNDVLRTGVVVIASVHGHSMDDVRRRGQFAALLDTHAFRRIVVLSRRRGAGTVELVAGTEIQRVSSANGAARAEPPMPVQAHHVVAGGNAVCGHD